MLYANRIIKHRTRSHSSDDEVVNSLRVNTTALKKKSVLIIYFIYYRRCTLYICMYVCMCMRMRMCFNGNREWTEQSRVASQSQSQSKMKTWHTTWCIPLSRIRDFVDVIFAASANSIKRVRGWYMIVHVFVWNVQTGTHTLTTTPCIARWQSCNMLKLSKFQHRLHYMRYTYQRNPPPLIHCLCGFVHSNHIFY